MSEEKSFCDKLIEGLGNLIPEDQVEAFREQAQQVAEESMQGFMQLRTDIEQMATSAKRGAEKALEQLEEAFVQFQLSVEQMNERRRRQAEDVYNKLGVVIEKLETTDVRPSIRSELKKRTEAIMEYIKQCGDRLSEEVVHQTNLLAEALKEETEGGNSEIQAAINDLLAAIETPSAGRNH